MKTKNQCGILTTRRNGLKDIWNASLCDGALYSIHDIPFCPTTATTLPREIITWDQAKRIYKQKLSTKEPHFLYDAFVCWYIDDYKFDGPHGIWYNYKQTLHILRHHQYV